MGHVGVGIQASQNNDSADDNLSEHACHKTPGEPQKIVATWSAQMGHKNCGNHTERHDTRKEPIELFDCRVTGRHVDKLGVIAIWPITAPKTRVGETHQSSRKDNHAERSQCGPANDSIGLP